MADRKESSHDLYYPLIESMRSSHERMENKIERLENELKKERALSSKYARALLFYLRAEKEIIRIKR